MKKLNAVRFQTQSGSKYVYDAVSNRVFPCPDVFYEVLTRYIGNLTLDDIRAELNHTYSPEDISDSYECVHTHVEQDRCFRIPLSPTQEPDSCWISSEEEYWRKLFYQTGCTQLVLIVTEDCNLRCRYCSFASGEYKYQRPIRKQRMPFEVAKASIDYFTELQNQTYVFFATPTISFYGGEPLLELDLLQQCVEYAKSCSTKYGYKFALTTNATLLTDRVIDFLIENDVQLAVSLDGPESVHDKNRIFPSGKGTYEKVMAGLQTVLEQAPEYYRNRVVMLSTYDWGTDLAQLNRYIVEDDGELLPLIGRATPVSNANTYYYRQFTKEEQAEFWQQIGLFTQQFYEFMTEKYPHNTRFIQRLFVDVWMFAVRSYARKSESNWYTGACLPGMKLAVDPSGLFHICEKINYHFPIGDYQNGLDIAKIKRLVTQYSKQLFGDCSLCIAQHNCPICWALIAGEGEFTSCIYCTVAEQRMTDILSLVYSILEEKPHAFEMLSEVFKTNIFMDRC